MNINFPLQSYIIKNTFIDRNEASIYKSIRRCKSCINFTYIHTEINNSDSSKLIIKKKNKKKKEDFDNIIKKENLINKQTLENIANINKINEWLSYQNMKPKDILIKKIQEYILSDIIIKINNVINGWGDYLKIKYKKKISLIINNANKQLEIYYNLIKYYIEKWLTSNYDNLLNKKNNISEIKNYLNNNLSHIKINDKKFNECIEISIIYDDINL